MLDVSLGEMLLIGTVALIVLGPERLPKTARWAGKMISTWRHFLQRTKQDIEEELQWQDVKKFGQQMETTWSESVKTLHSSFHPNFDPKLASSALTHSLSEPMQSITPGAPVYQSEIEGSEHLSPTPNTYSNPQESLVMDTSPSPIFSEPSAAPLIGIVMGSVSDWKVMKHAARILKEFNIPFEAKVVSAHRMPDTMFIYAATARQRGLKAIIAGAGGAAHLPGMLAAKTTLPVLGVPIAATLLNGQDALYSIVQMPKGIPVATFAIGEPGAANAALFAASLLSTVSQEVTNTLENFRAHQTAQASQSHLDVENLE